jgi:hypothetical protein
MVVVLLTLFTLPGYGLANLAQRSCQEEMRAANQIALAGDCCPGKTDQGVPCKSRSTSPLGKGNSCTACKAGYNCKSPQSYEPAPGLVLFILPARPVLSVNPTPLLLSYSPDGLWRPPQLA